MKKGPWALAAMFLGIAVLAQGQAQKKIAASGQPQIQKKNQNDASSVSGMSAEEATQFMMMTTSRDSRSDMKNSLSDMERERQRKAAERAAITKQKAAQAKTKNTLVEGGKTTGKAPVTVTTGTPGH